MDKTLTYLRTFDCADLVLYAITVAVIYLVLSAGYTLYRLWNRDV